MKARLHLLLLFSMLLISCNEKKEQINLDKLKTFNLENGNLAFVKNPLVSNFSKIDTLILSKNADPNAQYRFSLFDLNYNKLFEIGEIGTAPDKIEKATIFSNVVKDSITKLYLYQINKKKLSSINLDKSLAKGESQLLENIDIKTEKSPQDIIALNDYEFIYNPSNLNLELENKRYYQNQLISSDTKEKYYDYIKPEKNKSPALILYGYNYPFITTLHKNPSKNLFCQTFLLNKIEVFDEELKTTNSLQIQPEINKVEFKKLKNITEESDLPEIKIKDRLISTYVDDSFIWQDITERNLFRRSNENSNPHTIVVMDWKLNLACKLKIDPDINVYDFIVIEEKNKLLINDIVNEKIIEYDISRVFSYLDNLN